MDTMYIGLKRRSYCRRTLRNRRKIWKNPGFRGKNKRHGYRRYLHARRLSQNLTF